MRKGRLNANKVLRDKYSDEWHKNISLKANEKAQKVLKFKRDNDSVFKDKVIENTKHANKLSQTPESKLKQKETMKSNSHQQGEKNGKEES